MQWIKNLLKLTPSGPEPNSLNIYWPPGVGTPSGDIQPARAELAYVEKPVGPLMRSINDNKWYHVHFWHEGKGKGALGPPVFPDEVYASPRELAEVMEAAPIADYYTHHHALLEKISPAFFVGALGILVFALIIFGGKQ